VKREGVFISTGSPVALDQTSKLVTPFAREIADAEVKGLVF
jgi:hypothetical protein